MTNEELEEKAQALQASLVLLRPQYNLKVEAVGVEYTRAAYEVVLEAMRGVITQAYDESITETCHLCANETRLERDDNGQTFHLTPSGNWAECRARAIHALKNPLCLHKWVDARNEVVKDGEYCSGCGVMRPSEVTAPAFILDQADQLYYTARYHKETWPIGYDKPAALAIIERLNAAHRPNLERRGSELWVCWNDHEKGHSCEYELLVEKVW